MIVCGVDTSDAAVAVVALARRLADRLGQDLIVGHVADGPGDQAERLATIRERAGAEDAEVRLLPPDPAADALIAAAADEGASLLVVGSRGHSALRSGLLGSVTRELAARSPIRSWWFRRTTRRGRTAAARRPSSAASMGPATPWPRPGSPAGWRAPWAGGS